MNRFNVLLIIGLVLTVIFLYPFVVKGETLKIAWDFTSEDSIDGFNIYSVKDGNENLLDTVTPDITGTTVDIPVVLDAVTDYTIVVRAFKGTLESVDSNEVPFQAVGIRPVAPDGLNGSYNKDAETVSLSWNQSQDEYDIAYWTVYYRLDPEDEFIKIGNVMASENPTLTEPFTAVEENTKAMAYFAVVAFRADADIYSANSDSIPIEIDRLMPPPAPTNVQISVEIEVQ